MLEGLGGELLSLGGTSGSQLEVQHNSLAEPAALLIDGKSTSFTVYAYNNVSLISNDAFIVERGGEDEITIRCQDEAETAIGAPIDKISRVVADGTTVCDTPSACNAILEAGDHLITVHGRRD